MRYEKATRDFYTFTCVGGLELFVLSDGGHTWCFHPQHTLRCYISLLYPCSIISSFYFVYTTLPLCLIPFCHMFCGIFESFHQLQYNTQLEFVGTEASGVQSWFFVWHCLVVFVHVCTLQIAQMTLPAAQPTIFFGCLLSPIYCYSSLKGFYHLCYFLLSLQLKIPTICIVTKASPPPPSPPKNK